MFWLIAKSIAAVVFGIGAIFLLLLLVTVLLLASAWLLDLVLAPPRDQKSFEPDPWIDHPRA